MRRILSSPVVILVICWFVPTLNFVFAVQSKASLSVHTRATITHYEPSAKKKPASIDYSYQVDGKTYQGSFNGGLKATQGEIDIWYDPNHPDESTPTSPKTLLGLLVGGYCLLNLTLFLFLRRFLSKTGRHSGKSERPVGTG